MQNTKRAGRTEPEPLELLGTEDDDYLEEADSFEMHHATCPDCGQSIALLADEEFLPQHALCLTPWNPFGLTVCAGTGRPAADALPAAAAVAPDEAEPAVVLALPQGLDWRTQPFSHVGGPGSRPVRLVTPAPRPGAQLRGRHVQAA
ncbi:hypothetical protein [Streptomyces antimicrobicus]|uniref:Uncharacterized protein n=1 Tax=Streptomyces antimicrobicus TaxID=2883108 RepID=A0ABS8B7L7_9ACTN|nr:hypothetical protein [Streptomyces antimicrobicus]MCB5180621.1 hypothetical protein [Streptomyces antimicrobicus]